MIVEYLIHVDGELHQKTEDINLHQAHLDLLHKIGFEPIESRVKHD